MSSGKIILLGAISVVFGLYNLSLIKVDGAVGRAAEIALYQAKASENAKSGVQKTIYYCAYYLGKYGGGNVSSITVNTQALDTLGGMDQGTFTSYVSISGWNYFSNTYQGTIVSHGYYRSPNEPAAFAPGHEVVRTAFIEIAPYSGSWYNIRIRAANSVINYSRERMLDSLQEGKSNLFGY